MEEEQDNIDSCTDDGKAQQCVPNESKISFLFIPHISGWSIHAEQAVKGVCGCTSRGA